MDLPFTTDQFFQVFADYNLAIWPAQVLAYLLGAAAVWLLTRKSASAGTWIFRILGLFWIWMGVVYHILFFARVNSAAYLFGALFVLQGMLFLFGNRSGTETVFAYRKDGYGILGTIFLVYGMVIYPLLGYALGHQFPASPVFGVAPCPTTIFTFGLLLHVRGRLPLRLLAVPFLWSLIGFSAAVQLTVYEDMGLVIAGIAGTALILHRNRKNR